MKELRCYCDFVGNEVSIDVLLREVRTAAGYLKVTILLKDCDRSIHALFKTRAISNPHTHTS